MALHLRHLSPPVVIVTRGRGAESFDDAGRLLVRLEELPAVNDEVMQIERAGEVVTPEGIAALNCMLRTVGMGRFETASKRQTTAARCLQTKYNWAFLGEYLGWEWRARK
jgi:hypothetical protein